MDGVDAAVLETDGERILGFGPSAFRAYAPAERAALRAALGRWPGDPGLEAVETQVRAAHRAAVAGFEGVEVVGFHGQTLAHEPRGRGTHQIGRGDLLARECGLPVVWDFRTADVASGGEGAPLVPFFHFACARWIGADGAGGVPEPRRRRQRHLGRPARRWPRGARRAGRVRHRAGERAPRRLPRRPHRPRLRRRRQRWRRPGGSTRPRWPGSPSTPTSCGRRRSRWTGRTSTPSSTGSRRSPPRMARRPSPRSPRPAFRKRPGISRSRRPAGSSAAAGGGTGRSSPCSRRGRTRRWRAVEAVGLDGDMLEAQAFAFLAVRVLGGLATSAPGTTGARLPVSGGRISRP